jgi:hypothetical protein
MGLKYGEKVGRLPIYLSLTYLPTYDLPSINRLLSIPFFENHLIFVDGGYIIFD